MTKQEGARLIEVEHPNKDLLLASAINDMLAQARRTPDQIGTVLALAVALHAWDEVMLATQQDRQDFCAGFAARMLPLAIRVVEAADHHLNPTEQERDDGREQRTVSP